MPALAIITILKEYKKEIFWLICLIIGLSFYYKMKSDFKTKKATEKIKEVVDGSKQQDAELAASIGVTDVRIAILRNIAHKTAYNLGTLPTQVTWFNTEDEEAVIFQLNKAETAAEILTIAEFYEAITDRSLSTDLKLLNNSERARIKFYTSLQ